MKLSIAQRDFLNFVHLKLSDPDYVESLGLRAMDRIATYLSMDSEDLVKRINSKLIRGASDHGDPLYSQERIEEELNLELDDLIFGWPLVGDYNLWIKNKSTN